jgi:WSC domain
MTVEACLDACTAEGMNLAAVEYSRECYCGNTILGANAPIANSNCNYACTGNPNEACGGSAALNLYVNNNYAFTTGPGGVVQSYKGYVVNECWEYV